MKLQGIVAWTLLISFTVIVPNRFVLAEQQEAEQQEKGVSAQESSPPNILLIISDDQAWTDYGFMGHSAIKTPHLDELARQSILFRRGYVPTALCRPSLLTLATGQYAHRHGVTGNDPSPKYAEPNSPEDRDRRARLISSIDSLDTVPRLLAEQGYLSHQSGKWWEGSYQRGGFTHGMTRGFPEPGDGMAMMDCALAVRDSSPFGNSSRRRFRRENPSSCGTLHFFPTHHTILPSDCSKNIANPTVH
jgi:hypothetical protein